MKTAASGAEKPRSVQQKSVYGKRERRRSHSIQQKSMHRKRDKEVQRHSAEDCTAEFGCVRGDARGDSAREREMGHERSYRPHWWC